MIPNRVRCLLKGGAFPDLRGDGVVPIKGLCLCEAQYLSKEIQYICFYNNFLVVISNSHSWHVIGY